MIKPECDMSPEERDDYLTFLEADRCPDCGGRNLWLEAKPQPDGTVRYEWSECKTCKGLL